MDVKLPDGTVISNIPEGTTKQQIVDKLAANGYDTKKLGMTSQAQAFRPADALTAAPSVGEQLIGGAKHAWDKGAQGLKELLPQPVQDAGDWVERKLTGSATDLPSLTGQGEAFVKETGPASTVGEIGGQIALTAAPAARVFKAVAGANPALWRTGAAAASSGAAPAAVLTPGDAATRAEAAAYDAAGGLAGEAGGRVLKRTLTGLVTPSHSAEQLMARGIQPTVGQGAASPVFRAAEDFLGSVPVVGATIVKGQKRAVSEFQKDIFDDAWNRLKDPTNATLDEVVEWLSKQDPRIQVRDADAAMKGQYERILGQMEPVEIPADFVKSLSQTSTKLPMDVRHEYNEIMKRAFVDEQTGLLRNRPLTGHELKTLYSELGELSGDLLNNGTTMEKRAARALGVERSKLQELFPAEMRDLDNAYARFLRFKEASQRTMKPEEGITPAKYQQAVKSESFGDEFAKGRAAGQDISDPAQILTVASRGALPVGVSSGAAGLAHLSGNTIPALVAQAIAAFGASRPGAALAFGNTNWQKQAADALRRSPAAPAIVGAALTRKREDPNKRRPLNDYR